jgi:hypothetical protein
MNDDKSKVGELNDTLYSRTKYQEPADTRSTVSPQDEHQVEEGWKSPELDQMLQSERRAPEQHSFMKKLFILAVVFFLIAVGVSGYIFWGGANFISSKNVNITVLGPATLSAGDVIELSIIVENKNNADLVVSNLAIQYPTGSRDPKDTTQSLNYVREELGGIEAGREVTRNAQAVIFGEKGEVKEIKISLDYKVKGSNATFSKEKKYEIVIGETPVTMTVTKPDSVTSGEVYTTTVTLSANSTEVIRNVMVRAEYPYGFQAVSSTPTPVAEDNVWLLGNLEPGEKKLITLRGKLVGENDEERTFRFYMGVADSGSDQRTFKTNIASLSETISISRPSVGLSVELNGDNSTIYTAPASEEVRGTIRFQNNLPDKIIDPTLKVKFTGAVDKFSVQSQQGGFYDSSSNTIEWEIEDQQGGNEELSPGDRGQVAFAFKTPANSAGSSKSQEVGLEINFSGTLISDGKQIPISVTESRTVKITSQVTLSSKSLYSKGPYSNTGPIPPKAEKETTYTVVLTLGNTQNDVEDGKLTAVLGQNVKWLGKTSPSGTNIDYNENSNTVTWDVGDLESGTGFSTPGKEAVFQVSFTPSISQVGTVPVLVGNISFKGTDSFVDRQITVNASPVTTRISLDPKFIQGDEVVVK